MKKITLPFHIFLFDDRINNENIEYFFEMCSQNTGKTAEGNTFLITSKDNAGFTFRRNCLALEFN